MGPEAALKTLEKQGFESVVLTGGATLNAAFAQAGLIDEVIFNVEPVIEGKGIPPNYTIGLKSNCESTEN